MGHSKERWTLQTPDEIGFGFASRVSFNLRLDSFLKFTPLLNLNLCRGVP
jgi:hypothetical protein